MTAAELWWVNTCTVATNSGATGVKRKLAAPVERDCWIEEGEVLVRNADGTTTTSRTQVFVALELADDFTEGSEVTVRGRKAGTVHSVARFDSGSLELGVDHAVVALV